MAGARKAQSSHLFISGLRSGPDLFARVSFETRPPRDLNPDLKTDYAYDAANPITDIEVVLPATIGRPLVVEFDTTNLEQSWTPQQQASGAVRATAVPYLVIPRSVNRKLACDASASVRIDERSRLVTNVRSPGEYDILTMTRAGEAWVVGHRHAADARVAGVKVQPGVQARVSVVDGQGQPLSGAMICTAAPSPEIVWALAQAHRKDYIRYFSRQTTSAGGTRAFSCQPSSADPSQWLIYHESIGVFRPVRVSGSLRDGFQLSTGTRVASGSVTVKADVRDLAGKKLLLCVSPVFIENSGTMTELFAFLGATIEVVDGEARPGQLACRALRDRRCRACRQ